MKIKTNLQKENVAEAPEGAGDERKFCSVQDCIGGLEDVGIRARFERIHKRILEKFKKTGFVSPIDYMGESEYDLFTGGRRHRIAERIRRKIESGIKFPVRRASDKAGYVTEESRLIVEKLDRIIERVREGRRSRKRSQSEIDRDIIRKFYADPTPTAFSLLWDRFKYGIHSHISGIIGDWERANDLVQDTFQRAWEKKFMYDPEKSNFSTWLYTIARNITFSQIKKDSQERTIDVDVNDVFAGSLHPNGENAAGNESTYYISGTSGGIETGGYEDVNERMYDASVSEIRSMDPLFQRIIEMKNIRNMTLREIAGRMNMTESKIKNCYYKNKEILAETLKTKYSDLYVVYREASHDRDEEESVFF